MKNVDVLIIGGGIVGCFVARNLCRWNLESLLIEADTDVCMGITRANAAIVYSGCDNKPGSLKAALTVKSNRCFLSLCEELDVPFRQRGSLMVSEGARGEAILKRKFIQGEKNGVLDMKLLSGAEARILEPGLAENITAALYVPSTATVNPWQLGIAALENAVANGCRVMKNTCVINIVQEHSMYHVETNRGVVHCRAIINCAGLASDQIQEMAFQPSVRLEYDAADFFVFEKGAPDLKHIVFQECENGKGATAVPTVEGTLLMESPSRLQREGDAFWSTTTEGLARLKMLSERLLPGLDFKKVIRSFAAVRPNPYLVSEKNKRLNDFVITRPAENFFSFIGIKTPGLTCANALAEYVVDQIAEYFKVAPNKSFMPRRNGAYQKDYEVVCQCEQVTKKEILTAIERGACTVDGVKHRAGCGMGRCQGARCRYRVETLLEDFANGTV